MKVRRYYNLRKVMLTRGATTRDLARALGLCETTMYNKINGYNDWKLWEMYAVRDYLGAQQLTLDQLFRPTPGDMTQDTPNPYLPSRIHWARLKTGKEVTDHQNRIPDNHAGCVCKRQ